MPSSTLFPIFHFYPLLVLYRLHQTTSPTSLTSATHQSNVGSILDLGLSSSDYVEVPSQPQPALPTPARPNTAFEAQEDFVGTYIPPSNPLYFMTPLCDISYLGFNHWYHLCYILIFRLLSCPRYLLDTFLLQRYFSPCFLYSLYSLTNSHPSVTLLSFKELTLESGRHLQRMLNGLLKTKKVRSVRTASALWESRKGMNIGIQFSVSAIDIESAYYI